MAKVEAAQAKAPKVSWSKGAPQFSNADGSFTFRPRGRLFVDASSTGGSDFADRNISGTEIRSVRLGAEGSYGRLGYVVEGDFADNEVAWKSVYASVDHRLFGAQAELSIGNRLNDRGLDGSSSTTNTPFADRNVVGTLILPQRGLFGVGLTERVFGQGWHASLSVAGNDLNNAGEDNDSLTVAARAHWNPLLSEAATVHLGAWAFHEDIPAGATGVLRSSAISGHFNDLVKIAPGALAGAERGTAYGVEAAGFFGPGWVSGEWGTRRIGGVGSAGRYDVDHSAWTVSGGVFLFGASPAYTAKSGTWGKVKVQDPVTSRRARGLGAARALRGCGLRRAAHGRHRACLDGGHQLVSQRLCARHARCGLLADRQPQRRLSRAGRGLYVQHALPGGVLRRRVLASAARVAQRGLPIGA